MPTPKTLAQARRDVSNRLRGLELPACFVSATHEASRNASARKTDEQRAARKRLHAKARQLPKVTP